MSHVILVHAIKILYSVIHKNYTAHFSYNYTFLGFNFHLDTGINYIQKLLLIDKITKLSPTYCQRPYTMLMSMLQVD